MPRKLTATTVVVIALAFSGCGKDSSSDTTAQTVAAPATTATATTTTAKKAPSGTKTSKSTGTKTSASKTATTKTTAKKPTATTTTAKKATAKTTTATKTTPKTPSVLPGVTPKTTTTDVPLKDSTSGTGSGPAAERQAVVFVLHRYYKAFIAGDGAAVCDLLTSEGKTAMIADGGDKSCAKSAERLVKGISADNLKLLQATSDGIHIDDITVTGNGATAQIGKESRLRLSQENGKWLVRNPNVEPSKG